MKIRLYQLLKWAEKYTKTDMLYLARGGFWLILGQIAASLTALGVSIAFANLVSPETFGTYKYILAIASLFAIFSLPGMQTAATRAIAKGYDGVLPTSTKSRVLFSLIGSFAGVMGSGYYLYRDNLELSVALLIIAVTLPFFETFTGYLAYMVGKRRFDLQTKYQTLTYVIGAVTLIATLFFTNNLVLILIAYFLPTTLTRVLLYWNTVRRLPQEVDVTVASETLTYGKHLTAMSIFGVAAMHIDKILLWKFLGPAQLAIYTFALAFPEQIKGVLKGISELAFPKFAAQTPAQIRQNMPSLWRKLGIYTIGLFGLALIYIFMAPYIFKILFPQYMESVIYSQILSITLIFYFSAILEKIFEAQRDIKIQYTIQNSHHILRLLLCIILIPFYGILGAILAQVISRAATTAFLVFLILKQYPRMSEQ